MTNGVWEDEQTKKTKDLVDSFETFLNKETKVNDSELSNDVFNKISDLNKYLETVTTRCRCANLKSYCAKPQNGAQPIGCSGDPCQTDQGGGIEPDSPRAKMNLVINLNQEKSKTLLDFQGQIKTQRLNLEQAIRKYQEIETETLACEAQMGEFTVLSKYLSQKQALEESGIQAIKIQTYYAPKQSNLTFYCAGGGTLFDSNFTPPSKIKEDPNNPDIYSESTNERLGCPVELNTGTTLDNLKELGIVMNAKLGHVSSLIDDLTKKLQDMESLASQCNDKKCNINCSCVPNPCYMCCEPPYCGPCIPFCLSRCIQSVGGCNGNACPTEEINKKTAEIKEVEDTLFREIKDIKTIFPKIPKLKLTMNNLDVAAGLCSSSDFWAPTWEILSCQSAINNYDKNGQLITACHPRNIFCCTLSETNKVPIPVTTDTTPFYVTLAKKFPPLTAVNDCPKDYVCNPEVKTYKQYNDASEPLKQLLACMRVRLNRIEDAYYLEDVIGVIAGISDPNIAKKTCGWQTGTTVDRGCKYSYTVENGKERVSAHYGGLSCRYDNKSYAVDFDITGGLQKEYADEIIAAAKECNPTAYVLDETPYIHIDVAQTNQCSAAE